MSGLVSRGAAPSPPGPRLALALCALALGIGAALRALGLASDLWLDEVWTWWNVRALPDAASVFTLHDSNNHYLNTLWFYAAGDAAPGWWLRMPAWLAGSASVGLGAALAWRRGRLEAVFAALLLAGSFALVHFSSEARGYATVVMFALAAQLALEADLARPRARSALAFAACAVLGLLAQLIFVFYWAGALAQSFWCLRSAPRSHALRRLLALHAAPALLLVALYAIDLRGLVVGGGNPTDLALLIAQSVGFALGLPIARALAIPYAAAALCLIGAGLALRIRARDASWIQAAVTMIAPIALFAALRPAVIAERYFLIGIAFALLLGAELAAAGWRAGGARRALVCVAVAAFALGNASYIQAFARLGRGGFRAALLEMAARTPGPRVEVGSDHDFRNALVLAYYSRALPPGKQLVYTPQARWPQGGPEWFVRHAAQRPAQPAARIEAIGVPYQLVAEYDHAAISGFYWAVYHREAAGSR